MSDPTTPTEALSDERIEEIWRSHCREWPDIGKTLISPTVFARAIETEVRAILADAAPPVAPAEPVAWISQRGLEQLERGEATLVGPSQPGPHGGNTALIARPPRPLEEALAAPPAPQADPCTLCNALIVPRNPTHYDAEDLAAAAVRGKLLAATLKIDPPPAPQVVEALRWYADEAAAIARHLADFKASKEQAIMASLAVLSLDAGQRARAALASLTPAPSEGERK